MNRLLLRGAIPAAAFLAAAASVAPAVSVAAALGRQQPAPRGAEAAAAQQPGTDPACPSEHAAMGHCAAAPSGGGQAVQPHPAPRAAPDPERHPGHAPSRAPDAPASAPPAAALNAPAPAASFSGPEHAADAVWDPELMAAKRAEALAEHGGYRGYSLLLDRLEYRAPEGRDGYGWDAQGWYGGDYDRLWLKTQGEGAFGAAVEAAEVQALYSRAIDPWFNLQAGVRYDIRPEPERAHLVFGIQGLAPYWFEVEAAAFLSDEGDFTARLEAEYDQRITRRLILQPRLEVDLAAEDVAERGVGSGLWSVEVGARLRYGIRRELAPYVGVEYQRLVADGARLARAAGEDVGGWSVLAGLRSRF